MDTYDLGIIGGGLVGLATARTVTARFPGARVAVLEKEDGWARHQSGRNSGVIHSGVYYRPGSLKARFATTGSRALVRFCEEHGVPHTVSGKVIVAMTEEERPRLEAIFRRGRENGLDVRMLGPDHVTEYEPHCPALEAIQVPSAGLVDYADVARAYARLAEERGARLYTGTEVRGIAVRPDHVTLETTGGDVPVRFLVNCGGLFSDRLARLAGLRPPVRIVPFRGEYYDLAPEARDLVRSMIYPVPDPQFPFLGVHLTRTVDGRLHAGPNAVLALAREGYRKHDVDLRDLAEALAYPGVWALGRRAWRAAISEAVRSFSKRVFLESLQRLVPDIRSGHLTPAPAGVRAMALRPNGDMVDDFLTVRGERSLHVCNAPSPAATASIPIGEWITDQLPHDLF